MPRTVGVKGADDHDKLVKDLVVKHDHFFNALTPRFAEMVIDHKLWLGHREDKRQAHEQWRSWSWMGDPYSLTTVETDSWMEILNSMDPPFQAEGVGAEDEWKARGYERYIDYFLRGNKWTWTLEMAMRNLSIQGWYIFKPGWREVKFSPIKRPSRDALAFWDNAVNDALKTGQVTSPPDPQSQPQEFQNWLQSTQATFPQFPAPPQPAPSETVSYRGPWLYRPSPFEMRFDPNVEAWDEQETIMQRVVKPKTWTEAQVKSGKFDAESVKGAGAGADSRRLNQWDCEIGEKIGITINDQDPTYQNSDEFIEVWRPFAQADQYIILMNRTSIVNTSTEHPYWHRQSPYICMRNVPVERRAFGLGSYAQLRRTFSDRLLFRDLLLDGLLLSVMPVWLKSRSLGLPEMQRFLQPGMVLDVNDPNGLKPGWTSVAGFAELMRVGEMLFNDQNTLMGTWDNVRGQSATVGRVSATESQGRLTQALVRHKKKAERLEEEMSAILPQCLYLAYQNMPEDDPALLALRAAIIGQDEKDPMADPPDQTTGKPEFTREDFGEVLNYNIRFHGATSKINRELLAQQIQGFLGTVSQIQSASGVPVPIMSPGELRNLARRQYETLGLKGRDSVFSPEGDQAIQQATAAYLAVAATAPLAAQTQQAQAQQQLQAIQNPQPQQAQQRPPSESLNYKDAPPDIRRQMEQQAGMQPSQMPDIQPPVPGQPPQGAPPQGPPGGFPQ
jgi:hypothetical protein